tara:strand:- start:1448 stop:1687 length:240 start_codon:yes stop_codon:yes gene_type:complete
MPKELEPEIIATFKDGILTRGEYTDLMQNIRLNKNYLSIREHERLAKLAEQQGLKSLTKMQYVQCQEIAIFRATGVTRD